MTTRRALAAFVFSSVVFGASACSSPDTNARVAAGQPDRASFASVAPVLVRRCGSLDCHGEVHRNMRLFGYGGLRKNPAHTPDAPRTTQPAEIDADYEAVVGLEPEIMARVVADTGAGADRLTLIRKARLLEKHVGGGPIPPGDDADVCLLSWLAGALDQPACDRAAQAR